MRVAAGWEENRPSGPSGAEKTAFYALREEAAGQTGEVVWAHLVVPGPRHGI